MRVRAAAIYAKTARSMRGDYDIDSIAAKWLACWDKLWKMMRRAKTPHDRAAIAALAREARERFEMHNA